MARPGGVAKSSGLAKARPWPEAWLGRCCEAMAWPRVHSKRVPSRRLQSWRIRSWPGPWPGPWPVHGLGHRPGRATSQRPPGGHSRRRNEKQYRPSTRLQSCGIRSWMVHSRRIGYTPRAYPPGAYAPRGYTPGVYPPGVYPPGRYPPGGYPPGGYPPGGYPAGGIFRGFSTISPREEPSQGGTPPGGLDR